MNRLIVRVNGKPAPQGSHTAYVRGRRAVVVPVNKEALMAWRAEVTDKVRAALRENPDFDTEAEGYAVTTVFDMPRPKAHYGSQGALKASAPYYAPKRPDDDKLLRAISDGVTDACAWKDDSLVVERHSIKRYERDLGPGCWVIIRPKPITEPLGILRGAS